MADSNGSSGINSRAVTETLNMIASMNSSLPASFLQKAAPASQMQLGVRDPQTRKIDWILPNYGQFPVSHMLSFQSVVSSGAKVYRQYDEAIKNSLDNARYMRNDCGIMECLEARQRCVALLDWHLEPEDEKSESQKELCTNLTKILDRIRRFTEYRRVLLEAIWYGKYAIQHQFGWQNIAGHMRIMPKPRYEGQYGWLPINGDKLCFRFDDGRLPEGGYEGQMGIRVGMGYMAGDLIRDKWKIEPTERGMAYFIDEDERRQVIVHKHMIEDAPYEDALGAGAIHGIGVRSRIYWEWVQKQETLAFLMEYLERCAGGIQLWKFPQGNQKAKEAAEQAAQEYSGGGRNVLMVPIPIGDEFGQYGVEVVEPGMAGIDMLKDILTNYFGHRIKRYILGQILSSEAEATGLGSGVADLHMDTLLQIIKYDAVNLEETITFELLNRIKEWNFPEARNIHVKFKIDTEAPDVEKKLDAWSKAWEMGCKIKEQDVMQLIGAAMPGEDDEVLDKSQQEQQQQSAGGMFPGANFPPSQHAGGPTDDHAAATDPENQPPGLPQPPEPQEVDDDPVEGRGGPKDRFAKKHKPAKGQKELRWITINSDEAGGGTHIQIDGSGNIHAGPDGLAEKGIKNIHDFGKDDKPEDDKSEDRPADDQPSDDNNKDETNLGDVSTRVRDMLASGKHMSLREIQSAVGQGSHDPKSPLSHPVNAALKAMRDAGEVETHEPRHGEPSFWMTDEQIEKSKSNQTDKIPGGKSDDIPSEAFDADKVAEGADVESEHTSDPDIASEIARDHLAEDENYYDKLKSVEGEGSDRRPVTKDEHPGNGNIVVDKDGNEWLVMKARHGFVEGAPIENGKAVVNANSIRQFYVGDHINDKEPDKLYHTGRNYYAEQEKPSDPPASVAGSDQKPAAELFDEASESGSDPREAAKSAQKAVDADYEFARKSAVPNAGEDLKWSARHKVNAWRGLQDAEANGTAEAMVTRDNLLKAEPHSLMSHADHNPLTSLAMHNAIKSFPAKPGYGNEKRMSRRSDDEVKKDRSQYLDAYRDIKSKAEELAGRETNPMKAMSELQDFVSGRIKQLRESRVPVGDFGKTVSDQYNNTANALCDLHKKLSASSWEQRKSTNLHFKIKEFAGKLAEKYPGAEPKDIFDKVTGHVKDLIEGRSMPATFGESKTGEKREKEFDPSAEYVEHATRSGGPNLGDKVSTPTKATKYMTENLGMRGVQWGNSVTDDEREHHAKKSAEAFADLADILGLPPEAVSLGGKLGLAIGARGHGNASAHYEPGSVVINLTRKNGVGTLAHEWGHAFDHMLGDFKVSQSGGNYKSENTSPKYMKYDPIKGVELDENKKPVMVDNTQDPIWVAMDGVRQAFKSSGFQKRLSQAMDEMVQNNLMSKKRRQYWASTREMFARTFERHIRHKLNEAGRDNTYLSGLAERWGDGEPHKLWPSKAESAAMAPAFDALFEAYRKSKNIEPHKYSRADMVRYFMGEFSRQPGG